MAKTITIADTESNLKPTRDNSGVVIDTHLQTITTSSKALLDGITLNPNTTNVAVTVSGTTLYLLQTDSSSPTPATTSNGEPVIPTSTGTFSVAQANSFYGITSSGTANIHIRELTI